MNKKYYNIDDVKNKLKIINDDIEIIEDSNFVFKDIRDKVHCKCKKCGNISYKAMHSLLQGYGCKYCYNNNNRHFYNNSSLKEEIYRRTNGEYTLISNHYRSRDIGTFYHNSNSCKNSSHVFNMKIHGFMTLNYRCPYCNVTAKGLRDSKGARKIKEVLDLLNISYEREKAFNDCRSSSGRLLYFDFYIPDYNLLIEFDGPQHRKSIDYFGGIDTFNKTKSHDDIKNKYAENNNINLIRLENIKDIDNTLKNILIKVRRSSKT